MTTRANRSAFSCLCFRKHGLLLLSCSLIGLAGCEAPHGVTMRKNNAPLTQLAADSDFLPKPNLSPVLSPRDHLRIQIVPVASAQGLLLEPYDVVTYQIEYDSSDYRVTQGDELAVHFGGDGRRDFAATVRPDGKITLPDAGEIAAAGKTPNELAEAINAAYSQRLNQPSASVDVTRSALAGGRERAEAVIQDDGTLSIPRLGRVTAAGLTPAKLSENLSDLAMNRLKNRIVVQVNRQLTPIDRQKEGLVGFDRPVPVSADGHIVLPEIGAFAAAGKSPEALQAEIAEVVKKRYRNPMVVSVILEASEARVVYVGGEVSRPGSYPLSNGMTLMRAVMLAGGSLDTANLKEVVLIHRDAQSDVYIFRSNLKEFVEKGEVSNDLRLAPQDIVLLPKTSVAKANLWIDQYVTRMLPFSRSVNYTYSNLPDSQVIAK